MRLFNGFWNILWIQGVLVRASDLAGFDRGLWCTEAV